jgi:hypothetical protein
MPNKGTKRLYFPPSILGACCHSITCVIVQYGLPPIILHGSGNSPRLTQFMMVLLVTPICDAITFDATNVSSLLDCSLFTLRLLCQFLRSFLFLSRQSCSKHKSLHRVGLLDRARPSLIVWMMQFLASLKPRHHHLDLLGGSRLGRSRYLRRQPNPILIVAFVFYFFKYVFVPKCWHRLPP